MYLQRVFLEWSKWDFSKHVVFSYACIVYSFKCCFVNEVFIQKIENFNTEVAKL